MSADIAMDKRRRGAATAGRSPRYRKQRVGRGQAWSNTYLVTRTTSGCVWGCLLVLKDTMVVRGDGGVGAVTGPVRTRLLVHSTWVTVVLGHVSRSAVRARLRVGGVLGWALRRDRGVYGYITVRLDLLGIFMGILMGRIGAILKIQ